MKHFSTQHNGGSGGFTPFEIARPKGPSGAQARARFQTGFTLIELLVSLAVFTVIVLFTLGSVLSILNAGNKAKSLSSVMTNLNFTVELMSREIKFGTNYHCGDASPFSVATPPTPNDCQSVPQNSFSFITSDGFATEYKLDTNTRQILKSTDGGSNYIGVTAPEVVITGLQFYVLNSHPQSECPAYCDFAQPKVVMVINGYAGTQISAQSKFVLQTTISQRVLDTAIIAGTSGGSGGGSSFILSVSKPGTGTGTVTSDPAGINCGATCSSSYTSGTVVTLTAASSGGSTFSGWSGGGCSGIGTCVVTMSSAQSVTATFDPPVASYTLTVNPAGTGTGSVSSSPSGISCPGDCSESYTSGTTVTLTASPSGGSTFSGWSGGGCSGTGTCVVTMSSAKSVTATFDPPVASYTLTVNPAGTGTGSVSSSPSGISCPGDCSESYTSGTTVTLTASPSGGSTFSGWSGGGCSGTGTCVVTMSSAKSVTATFASGGGASISSTPLQNISAGGSADVASYSVTIANTTPGSTLILVWGGGGKAGISSIGNIAGRSWVKVNGQTPPTAAYGESEIWVLSNTNGTGGSFNVNLSSGTFRWGYVTVSEWTGIDTSNPVDSSLAGVGTSNPALSPSLTPTSGKNMLIMAVLGNHYSTGSLSGGSPFTNLHVGTPQSSAYLVTANTSGSYQASWSDSTSIQYGSTIAAFQVSP